jgi:hypothetical protein
MKNHIILIIAFCTLLLGANAQETIELDGMKIKKDILKPGREISLNAKEYKTDGRHGVDPMHKNKQAWSVKAAVPKNQKAYGLSVNYDYYNTELPSSNLKFFDEKGNKKWEKNLKDRSPSYSYLSDDGKHWIMHIVNHNHEIHLLTNSLLVFNEQGEIIFEVDSLADMLVSASKDLICYQRKKDIGNHNEAITDFYCYDMKNNKVWSKSFVSEVFPRPASLNGDYIIAYFDGYYNLYDRSGKELFHKTVKNFGGGISSISNDGKYVLANRTPDADTTHFLIFDLGKMERHRANYYPIPEMSNVVGNIYNGADFVKNSHYILSLTSIIAPYTAMIVFHNLTGEYLGHKVYYNIQSSFAGPDITLLDDGSFEVYMDGYYLGNLILPNVNTLKYLKI